MSDIPTPPADSTDSRNPIFDRALEKRFWYGVISPAVVLAVLYGSGFVVVFAGQRGLGIGGLYTDFLKLKYLHLGVLAATFVYVFAGSTYALLRLIDCPKKLPSKRIGTIHMVIGVVFMLGLLVRIAIGAVETFRWPHVTVLLLFCGSFLIIIFWRANERRLLGKHTSESLNREHSLVLMYFLLLALFYLCIELFSQLGITINWEKRFPAELRIGLWCGTTIMLTIAAALIGAVLYRMRYRTDTDTAQKRAVVLLGTPFITFLYYMIIWGLGTVLYPFVPVEKGGGDYQNARKVTIRYLAPCVNSDRNLNTKYVLLLETPEYLVLAQSDGHEQSWGKPFLVDPHKTAPAAIIQLPKDKVELVYGE
jgi:hypothetical protein